MMNALIWTTWDSRRVDCESSLALHIVIFGNHCHPNKREPTAHEDLMIPLFPNVSQDVEKVPPSLVSLNEFVPPL
jgi:hypothetical protein